MQAFTSIAALASIDAPVHLAIGVFDGVHRGHQAVIESAVASASEQGGVAVLVTFAPHPVRVLAPEKAPRMLSSHEHQLHLVEKLGMTRALVIPFDRAFSQLTGSEFVAQLVAHATQLASIHVGEDWCFGYQRSGNVSLLKAEGARHGFQVHGVRHITCDGETVSSTLVRRALEAGDLSRASALLGRDFSLFGCVQLGRQLARGLGFPTANIPLSDFQLPPFGVYVSQVLIGDQSHGAIANLGVRPTVEGEDARPLLEVHLFGFDGELYEQSIEVTLLKHLREERRFDGLDALKAQIVKDVVAAKSWLAEHSLEREA